MVDDEDGEMGSYDDGNRNTVANETYISVRRCSESSSDQIICRICHWEENGSSDPLVVPCYCSGSLRYVHQRCLQQWIKSSGTRSCELCKFQFIMNSKMKPVAEWECLQMSVVEKRKLICNVLFHLVALVCVTWSLYVLTERTVKELERGAIDWPFWTKVTVVAFGLFGVAVFKYLQCKAYINLCRRWQASNRVIFIENSPEKPALSPLVNASECVIQVSATPQPTETESQQTAQDETHALLNV